MRIFGVSITSIIILALFFYGGYKYAYIKSMK